jgi:predicted transcriptional regulator
LSDYIRLGLIEESQRWPEGRTVRGLCEEVRVPQSTLSWHLRTLSDVGIIKGERVGRQVFYRFDPESLDDAFILLYAFRIGRKFTRAK